MNSNSNTRRERGRANPSGASDAERMRILELLEQGQITAAEAAELLAALDEKDSRALRVRGNVIDITDTRPRWFRLRVTDVRGGRVRADVTIPVALVGFGVGLAHRLGTPGAARIDDLMEAVRKGSRGTIFDVSSGEDGERVEIILD